MMPLGTRGEGAEGNGGEGAEGNGGEGAEGNGGNADRGSGGTKGGSRGGSDAGGAESVVVSAVGRGSAVGADEPSATSPPLGYT